MTENVKRTHDAVETSVDLAKTEKTGTWEDIVTKKKRKIIQWEDISDVLVIEKSKSIPIISDCRQNKEN